MSKSPTKSTKDHAGRTSEGHGRDQGEEAREEAHQPRGATPGLQLQLPPVEAPARPTGRRQERMPPRRGPQHRNATRRL
jgi:hypothetical protein